MQQFFHKHFKNHYLILLFLFSLAFFLQVLQIGSYIRQGYTIGATLDFSWQSDNVARFLHGYIAGKDYIFTYGPLFALIESLSSIVFHLPAYTAVLLSPLFIVPFLMGLLYFFCRLVTDDKKESLSLLVYLFFVVGLSANGIFEQIFRLLPILIFSLLFFIYLYQTKNPKFWILLLISLLPSLLGLYTYDLFLQCEILVGIFGVVIGYNYFVKKHSSWQYSVFVGLTVLFQILVSFLLTGSFLYITASLDTITNYFYIMNIPLIASSSTILFIFPIFLPFLFYFTAKSKKISPIQKRIFFVLMITALIQLRTCLIRSDEGHIMMGIYPSIIIDFLFLFYLLKEKYSYAIVVFSLLFIIVPFKVNYTSIFSPKNILATVRFIQKPSTFLQIYTLPKQYSFTKQELETFIPLVDKNPGNVFVYPYDSYVLNIHNQTYNSYALQLYDYSNSFTEQQTVKNMQNRPPKYIVLGIDGKAAIPLDDIPNFTRNPLVAAFILKNYSIEKETSRYMLLRYNPRKALHEKMRVCTLQKVTFIVKENGFKDIFGKIFKSSLYYVKIGNHSIIRIPFKPSSQSYLLFDTTDATLLNTLFSTKINWDNTKIDPKKAQQITILQQSPFSKHIVPLPSQKMDIRVYCLN